MKKVNSNNSNEMKDNINRLKSPANDLRDDFIEAKKLRTNKKFESGDKEYFMTRCKQAEGIISATKNILENIKEIEKPIPEEM